MQSGNLIKVQHVKIYQLDRADLLFPWLAVLSLGYSLFLTTGSCVSVFLIKLYWLSKKKKNDHKQEALCINVIHIDSFL